MAASRRAWIRSTQRPTTACFGSTVFSDNLTVTVALGASLFNDRYGLQKLKPTRLIAMEQFPNDALEAH